MNLSKPLANGYYLHQVDCPKKIGFFPGNKINGFFIYDITYFANQDNVNLTRVFYLSTENTPVVENTIIFHQENNIISEIAKNPDIIICTEKSLSALFFYYRKFYKRVNHKPIIIIQTDGLLPFNPVPSKIIVPQLPSHMIASVPYFEDLTIPSRIASTKLDMPGWYLGDVTTLLNTNHHKIIIE